MRAGAEIIWSTWRRHYNAACAHAHRHIALAPECAAVYVERCEGSAFIVPAGERERARCVVPGHCGGVDVWLMGEIQKRRTNTRPLYIYTAFLLSRLAFTFPLFFPYILFFGGNRSHICEMIVYTRGIGARRVCCSSIREFFARKSEILRCCCWIPRSISPSATRAAP